MEENLEMFNLMKHKQRSVEKALKAYCDEMCKAYGNGGHPTVMAKIALQNFYSLKARVNQEQKD